MPCEKTGIREKTRRADFEALAAAKPREEEWKTIAVAQPRANKLKRDTISGRPGLVSGRCESL